MFDNNLALDIKNTTIQYIYKIQQYFHTNIQLHPYPVKPLRRYTVTPLPRYPVTLLPRYAVTPLHRYAI